MRESADMTDSPKDLSRISDTDFGALVKKFITVIVEFIKSLSKK